MPNKKKQAGPNWWQLMLIAAGLSGGLVYGTTGDLQAAIGAAVVAATGGRVGNQYNPDGSLSVKKKEGE